MKEDLSQGTVEVSTGVPCGSDVLVTQVEPPPAAS